MVPNPCDRSAGESVSPEMTLASVGHFEWESVEEKTECEPGNTRTFAAVCERSALGSVRVAAAARDTG